MNSGQDEERKEWDCSQVGVDFRRHEPAGSHVNCCGQVMQTKIAKP